MCLIDEIIEDLKSRKAAVACDGKAGLIAYMNELGFIFKKGNVAGHKVFCHKGLSEKTNGRFTTHSIDCGHKPKRPMKKPYVTKTISILSKYRDELDQLNGGEQRV